MSFDIKAKEGMQILQEELQKAYPDYSIQIAPDVDFTDCIYRSLSAHCTVK